MRKFWGTDMQTVYGFNEKKVAETLRDLARKAQPGTRSGWPVATDTGTRSYVCVPDADVPPALKAGDGSIQPGSGLVTVYEMDDYGKLTPRLDEDGDTLKLTAYSLAEETLEAGKHYLATEDAYGRLYFFFRPAGQASLFVRPAGPFYGWLDDEDDTARPEPILADAPAAYSLTLDGVSKYPAENHSADFKAAAIDTRGRLWRWVQNADGWYVSESLPDGKKYVRPTHSGAIYTPEQVFGGIFRDPDTVTDYYPISYGDSTFWRQGSDMRNGPFFNGVYIEKRAGSGWHIYDHYVHAYTLDLDATTEPEDGAVYTATPTDVYAEVWNGAEFTLGYTRTSYGLTDYEWTDSAGGKRLFGVPYWTIDGADFHLAADADGTTFHLEGELEAAGTTYTMLTWSEEREEWILGTLGDPAGWYSVQETALDITDGWKFSGTLTFHLPEDAEDPEERPSLTLTFKELRPETFSGPALVIHPERLEE